LRPRPATAAVAAVEAAKARRVMLGMLILPRRR
jgi:hypothetical protein